MSKRKNIEFISGDKGEFCRGWLYLPENHKGEAPAVIMAHGFGAVKELRLDAYAEKFAAAGFAVLVFDYRNFGSSDGKPRQLIDIGSELADWHSALRYIRSEPAIDATRIALWGTSFAGGHVAEVAAKDGNIRCLISQVPHLDGFASALAAGVPQAARLAAAAARDAANGLIGLEPYYVRVAGAPGELAAMTTENVLAIWPRMVPEGFPFDNRVAARIFLYLPSYSPGRRAEKLSMPWLIQAARHDKTTPVAAAERAAARAPHARLTVYDCDHFDVYLPPLFEKVVAEQVAFLRQNS